MAMRARPIRTIWIEVCQFDASPQGERVTVIVDVTLQPFRIDVAVPLPLQCLHEYHFGTMLQPCTSLRCAISNPSGNNPIEGMQKLR